MDHAAQYAYPQPDPADGPVNPRYRTVTRSLTCIVRARRFGEGVKN